MTFACVVDRVPHETIDALRVAATARDLAFLEVDARDFDYDPARRLVAGDLMYRPAASQTALRVEQFLYAPGVATFYAGDDDRPFFVGTSQPLQLERAGIPVPPTVYCATTNRVRLDDWAVRLGGYPILAKMGGQAGVGVVMLESARALYSFVDYALALGREPALSTYLRDGLLWRVVVVGTHPVVAYTCYPEAGDFRATRTYDASVFTTDPPPAVAALAVNAVRALRLEFGGVDILECANASYVLESNFPCYFPLAQLRGGIDVAGPMVDYLVGKAARSNASTRGS